MPVEPIPLKSRVIHKFYEPVVLLVALNHATSETAAPNILDAPVNHDDPKQVFHTFVYKLAHVCDSAKGGSSVTSFVVLQDGRNEDIVHYWFASNQRTQQELETTATFVRTLLRKVGQTPENPSQQSSVPEDLLWDVLRFNCPRISYYLRELKSQVTKCLDICSTNLEGESKQLAAITNSRIQNMLIPEPYRRVDCAGAHGRSHPSEFR